MFSNSFSKGLLFYGKDFQGNTFLKTTILNASGQVLVIIYPPPRNFCFVSPPSSFIHISYLIQCTSICSEYQVLHWGNFSKKRKWFYIQTTNFQYFFNLTFRKTQLYRLLDKLFMIIFLSDGDLTLVRYCQRLEFLLTTILILNGPHFLWIFSNIYLFCGT